MKKKVETPQFLVDLYRDLRDRRLLLPSLVLVVALIAVPVGLSHSASNPAAPPSVASTTGSKPTSAEPAVLVADPSIRSYRRRLAALKSKNPFQRHFALPKLHTGHPGALAPPTPAPSTPPVSTTPATPTTPTSTSTTTPTTTTDTVTVTKPSPRPVKHFFEYVIDVKVGLPGAMKERDDLRRLTVLPHQSNPVIVFLGQTSNGKGAAFSVSNDVASVDGDGTCIPDPSQCQYLTLKPDGQETFDYTPDGKTYGLKLLDVRRVEVHRHQQAHGKAAHLPDATELGPGVGTGK
jgi:hypothetical protein